MAKIISVCGGCMSKKMRVGFQFKEIPNARTASNDYFLGGSYVINNSSTETDGGTLNGSFLYGQGYKGCRLCGSRYVYQCCHCMSFNCYDGNKHDNAECPVCHKKSNLPEANGNSAGTPIMCSGTSGIDYPVDIILAIDTSGSMRKCNRIDEVKRAANEQFVNAFKDMPTVRMALVTFSEDVMTRREFTYDKSDFGRHVNNLAARGGTTSPFKHILSKHSAFVSGNGETKRFLVVFTDGRWAGNDEVSIADAERIKRSGVTIIAIGCAAADAEFLEQIATPGASMIVPENNTGGGFAKSVTIITQG